MNKSDDLELALTIIEHILHIVCVSMPWCFGDVFGWDVHRDVCLLLGRRRPDGNWAMDAEQYEAEYG